MSIWSGVTAGTPPVEGIDFEAESADQYKGTGPRVELDIAVAPSWNDKIRLAIDGDDMMATVGLDDAAAGWLIARLAAARVELRRREAVIDPAPQVAADAHADQVHADARRSVRVNIDRAKEAIRAGVAAQEVAIDLANFLDQQHEAERDHFAFLAAVAIVETATRELT